jgi:hypothetical protein
METPGGADEPGTNITKATFNGNRVDIGDSWRAEVPTVGVFACEYVTKQHQASLFLRLGLARRLLMPGSGRWAAIPEELRVPGEHIEEADTESGSEYHIRHTVVMIGTLDWLRFTCVVRCRYDCTGTHDAEQVRDGCRRHAQARGLGGKAGATSCRCFG